MIKGFFKAVWMFKNKDHIPKLPRGMLATKYDPNELTENERRVLARLGARDKNGIKRAIKKYGAKDIDDLVLMLQIQHPKRNFLHRLKTAVGRLVGGVDYMPHARAINEHFRAKRPRNDKEIEQRLKQAKGE